MPTKYTPFINVKNRAVGDTTGKVGGSNYMSTLKKLSVGAGDKVFRSDQSGIWSGGNKFNEAAFSVDMNGNAIMNSVSLSGYIPDGGALADIGPLGITETYIGPDAISSPKIKANAIVADKISANAVEAGKIATNAVTAVTILAGAVTSNKISVSQLSAITADMGSITAGIVTGATIRTAASGARFEISGTKASSYNATSELVRLDGTGLGIFGTSGNTVYFKDTAAGTGRGFMGYSSSVPGLYLASENATNLVLYGDEATYIFSNKTLYLSGDDEIYLDPGIGKVKLAQNLDLNERDLDAGNTLWAYSFSNRSDKRLKKNIKPINNSLDKIMELKPSSFSWKKNDKNTYGLIAQDLYKVIPELVNKADDGYLSVDYTALIPFLIKAVQELNTVKNGLNKLNNNTYLPDDQVDYFKRTEEEIMVETDRKDTTKYDNKNKMIRNKNNVK